MAAVPPIVVENLPTPQFVQALMDMDPVEAVYLPAGQDWQIAAPSVSPYLPAAQETQELAEV